MRYFKDLMTAIGTVILVLLLFEAGLRVVGAKYESSFYESDPVLYMALRPGAEGWEAKEGENLVRINSLGMRDEEHKLVPQPGTLRIALVGDSMVAAEEVPLEKTMAKMLQSDLRNAVGGSLPKSIEVLNFGIGGYTLAQEYLLLQTRVWQFQPNIVILFLSPSSVPSCNRRLYSANIPFFVIRDGKLQLDPANHPPRFSSSGARWWHGVFGDLMNRVRLLQLIRKATQDGIPQEIAKLRHAKPAHNENLIAMWLRAPSSSEQERAWGVAGGLLELMAQSAKSHGAELWLSPIGPEIEENPNAAVKANFLRYQGLTSFDYSEKRLQSIAVTQGIKFIPLEQRLAEYAERDQVSLRGFFNTRPNYGHWNETGNAVAAMIVADSLKQQHPELNSSMQSSKRQNAHIDDGS